LDCCDQLGERREGLRPGKRVEALLAAALDGDDVGFLQDSQVVRDCGLGEPDSSGDVVDGCRRRAV
jgi:hypothetical protein